jgi:hypothetical protein
MLPPAGETGKRKGDEASPHISIARAMLDRAKHSSQVAISAHRQRNTSAVRTSSLSPSEKLKVELKR